jgi:hypothetical protein
MSEPEPNAAPTLDDLTRGVARYQATYRHPALLPLAVSGLYDLDRTAPPGHATVATWPATWLHNGEPGVYAILMADLRVRYIGKADVLGKRLSTHFRGPETALEPRVFDPDAWPKHLRRYLVVIPMAQAFEVHSLEAYLIRQLRPPQNFVGRGPAPMTSSGSPQQDAMQDEFEA